MGRSCSRLLTLVRKYDLAAAVGTDGPFETHEIAGREDVLVAAPYYV